MFTKPSCLGVMVAVDARQYLFIASAALNLVACAETFDSSYPTYAAAVEAGAVQRGWVPPWLPSEARNLREVHNIDTNARMLLAEVPASATLRLPPECKPIQASTLPKPPFARPWWPKNVPEHSPGTTQHNYWQCTGQPQSVAVSETHILVWATE